MVRKISLIYNGNQISSMEKSSHLLLVVFSFVTIGYCDCFSFNFKTEWAIHRTTKRTNDHFDRICFDFQTSHFQWTQAKLLLWLLFSICAKRKHRKQLRVESWQSLSDSGLLWSCNKGQLLKHQMQITLPVVISLRRIHSTLLRLWPVKGGSGIWI